MADTQLAARCFEAINALEQKLKKRVTLAELGQRVAARLGETDPVDASVVAPLGEGQAGPADA
jgi:hypothetical protein